MYFALDAPFVRIIALFSNALENPGVISPEGNKWPAVSNDQLVFLKAQLERIKKESYQGAVIIAVHHPPFSYSPPKGAGASGHHSGSTEMMLLETDAVCLKAEVYPHAFLTAHARNYRCYTRKVKLGAVICEVPFIVCAFGG